MNTLSPLNSIHVIPNGILQINDPEMGNSSINANAGTIMIFHKNQRGPLNRQEDTIKLI
jgi:hypothetical protein